MSVHWPMLNARVVGSTLLLAASLLLNACQPQTPDAQRVLVVTIDTLRWDHLGFMGHDVATPNLDALAASGTAFTDVVTVTPLTLPAHSSLFTGLYPPAHGVRANGIFRLEDDVETIAEAFRAAGYATGAFVGAFVLDERFGLGQGFDHYDDELPEANPIHFAYYPERPASEVVERALSWIERQGEGPFFAWVHVFDPHAPYLPPAPFDETYAARPYDGEIAATDRALGPLLDRLRSMDDTLVVVTSDHGESLGEHGESTHGLFIYDSTTRVPLVMSGTGVPRGKIVESRVRSVDVAPTVLELSGLELSSEVDGQSLTSTFVAETTTPRDAYTESFLPRYNFNWSELQSFRQGKLKLIKAPKPELYDLEADPGETSNLWTSDRPEAATLMAELDRVSASARASSPVELDSETASKLESLGYLATAAAGAGEDRERPDPKDRVEVSEHMHQLLSPELTPEESMAGLRAILEIEPTNTLARNRLANTLSEQGRLDEAIDEYQRIMEDSEIDFKGLENLTAALLLRNRTDEALEATEGLMDIAPWNPDFLVLRGEALEQAGRVDDARAAYASALELEPTAENSWRLGAIEEKRDNPTEAEAHYRDALEHDAAFEPAVAALARLLARNGRAEEAYALLEGAPAELDRDGSQILTAKAEAHLAAGRSADAKTLLEQARRDFPENTRVLAMLGPLYAGEGNVEGGIEALEAAIALGENSPEVRRNLAVLYLRAGRAGRAVAELERAVAVAEDEAPLWYTLGNAYHRAGATAKAVEAYERALSLRRPWPEASFNLAVAAQQLGLNAKATEAYREFLAVASPSDTRRRREAEDQLRRLTGES